MKEKYVGKVKVPFCVRVDAFGSLDREELTDIYQELGFTMGWVTESFNYDGFDSNCEHDCWNNSWRFGDNTTVYTLEELQAIIDGVDNEAIPSSQPETSDGWISWSGGEMPLPTGTLIDVKHRDGDIFRNRPAGGGCNFDWYHSYEGGDIVAYRIVEKCLTPHPVPSSDDTATLGEDEYVGIASGETGSTDSVGSSVKITANISFNVMIKGQTFTLTSDELKELYTQLCVAEGSLQDWSIGNE